MKLKAITIAAEGVRQNNIGPRINKRAIVGSYAFWKICVPKFRGVTGLQAQGK